MRPKILRYVFVAILCALVPMVIAPVAGMPPGVTALTRDSAEVPLLALAPPPLDKRVPVLTHDPSTPAPLRIGELIDVHITPANAGRWDVLADGSARWRLALTSPGAVTVSLGFTRFRLPQGAVLTVRNAGGAEQVGPFRAADNQAHGQLWTPLVTGELVQLELVLPVAERDALELELTKFAYGILDPFNMPRDKSGSCNVDVVCPEGNAWRDQIQSVALIVINGTALCSGALVNNTSQNQRPFFLTAYHCGINLFNAASVVSYWNYQNSTCRAPNSAASGQPGDGSKAQALVGGAMLQAENPASDMTLIEFNQAVPASYKPAWAGWDRSGAAPPSAVGIHHPLGDEKRISFENQPTRITSYGGSNSPGAATHLRVIDWDLGTTEPGSSGSPLFDQNKRIVGQLHGGLAACGNNDSDWYGRFSVSWVQGGLAGLLDPLNTGAVTLDTLAGLSFTSGVPLSPLTPRPYRHVFTTTRPVTFAITSGVLPGGLSLNGATGVLSGIPPAVGTYGPFVVTASSGGASVTQTFSLVVRAASDIFYLPNMRR